ncbi:unnamed protein product [Ectocarpus sp. CCAP 1310/34]|nr:unnamed protein product [Ectocarpus sp. CCAP 1310/34]
MANSQLQVLAKKVTEWVSKQEDPDGELLPDASQVPGELTVFSTLTINLIIYGRNVSSSIPVQTAKELQAKGLFKDKFTAALLNGVEPEDGGGVGTPFGSEGNGDCLLNSVAAFFAKEGGRGVRSAVQTMAVKLRLSVDDHFGAWYNYTSDVRERLEKNEWHVVPDVDNNWHVGSSNCARLMFLAQLRSIAKPRAWLQQFVVPILATVVHSPLRVFLPFNTFNNAQGGPWKHTHFLPAWETARRSTLHVAMTMGYNSSYHPPFDNATGYLEYVENQLPELNHFVTVSDDTAIVAKDRAVRKFRMLKSQAKEAVKASKRQVQDAMLGPELNKLTADEEEDVHRRLTDANNSVRVRSFFSRAESYFERCDADFERIMSYHVNEAREEAQRKADAAAEEARSREEQQKARSTSNMDGGKDGASKETKPANGQESKGKQDQGRGGKKKAGNRGKTGGKGDAKAVKKGGGGGKTGGKGDATASVNSGNGQEAEGKQSNGFDGSTAPKVGKDRNGDKVFMRISSMSHDLSCQTDVAQKGCLDIVLGTRLHYGRWNVKQPGYGTAMKVNMGVDQKEVESYDVLADDAESIVTMVARYVEVEVKYARTHVASGKGSPAGERGRSDNELVSPENSSKEEENIQIPVATNNGGTSAGESVDRGGLQDGGDRSRNNGHDDKLCGTSGMVSVKKEGGQSRKNGDKGQKEGKSDDDESDSSTDVEMGSDKKGRQRFKAVAGGRYKETGNDEESDSSTDAEIQWDNKCRQGSKAGGGGLSRGKIDDEGSEGGSDGGNDPGASTAKEAGMVRAVTTVTPRGRGEKAAISNGSATDGEER